MAKACTYLCRQCLFIDGFGEFCEFINASFECSFTCVSAVRMFISSNSLLAAVYRKATSHSACEFFFISVGCANVYYIHGQRRISTSRTKPPMSVTFMARSWLAFGQLYGMAHFLYNSNVISNFKFQYF